MAADLEIRISAELTEIKAALGTLQKDLQNVGRTAQSIGNDSAKSLSSIESTLGGAAGAVKILFAGLSALAGVQVFKQLAQQGIEFNAAMEDAQLGIASIITSIAKLRDEQGNLADGPEAMRVALGLAEKQLFQLRIAGLETAASTRELADAFQQAVGPGLAANLNLDEIRQLTIQITQAATALGVPTNQLSQEIRSILSGQIDINSRVAKTLGLSNEQIASWKAQGTLVAELQKRMAGFAEAGRLAADNFSVIKSNAKEAVDTLAGEIFKPLFDEIKNGIKDATTGLFDTKNLKIADDLKDAADVLSDIGKAIGQTIGAALRGVVELFKDFSRYAKENRESVDGLAKAFGLILTAIGKVVGLAATLLTAVIDIGVRFKIFQTVIEAVAVMIAGIKDGVVTLGAGIIALGSLIIKFVVSPFEDLLRLGAAAADVIGKAKLAEQLRSYADGLDEVSAKGFEAAKEIIRPIAEGKGAVAETIASLDKLATKAGEAAAKTQEAAGAGGRTDGLRNPPKTPTADADLVAKAQAEREREILDQQFKDNLISTEAYYKKRIELQVKAIDSEIAAERAKQAKLSKDDEQGQKEAETKIAILNIKRKALAEDGARDEFLARRELNDKLQELRARDLENANQTAEAAKIKLQLQFRDLLQRLKEEGNTAGVELVNKLINTEAARAQFEQLKKEFDRITTELQQKQQTTAAKVTTGVLTPAQGQQQDSVNRQAAIDQLTVLNTKLQELAKNTNDPAIVQGANAASLALQQMAIDSATGWQKAVFSLNASLAQMQQNFEQATANAGVDALSNFFMDLASGSKSAGDALKDFVRSFATSMAQIASRALATYAVLQLLDTVYPGLGKATAATMSVGVQHTGGMAGSGPRRAVDPLLFLGAPRYHSGGMVGLKSDEVPAILQKGEEVLSRNDPRNQANGGGGAGTRIINVIDPSLVSDYMTSSAGEKTVLNILQRNPGALRQVLA